MVFDQMEKMKINFRQEAMFVQPLEKLKRSFRKLGAIFKLNNIFKFKKDPIGDNPLKRKYYFLATFWVSIHLLVYFYLVSIANPNQNMGVFQSVG